MDGQNIIRQFAKKAAIAVKNRKPIASEYFNYELIANAFEPFAELWDAIQAQSDENDLQCTELLNTIHKQALEEYLAEQLRLREELKHNNTSSRPTEEI